MGIVCESHRLLLKTVIVRILTWVVSPNFETSGPPKLSKSANDSKVCGRVDENKVTDSSVRRSNSLLDTSYRYR